MRSNLLVITVIIVAVILIVKMVVGNQFVTFKDSDNFIIKVYKNGKTTIRYYENKETKRLTNEQQQGLIDIIEETDFFNIKDDENTEWDGGSVSSLFASPNGITVKYKGQSYTVHGWTRWK